MKRAIYGLLFMPALLSTLACAAGQVLPLTTPPGFAVSAGHASSVAIAARDQRDDIVKGDEKESLFGHQRSLYGIPFAVLTASGKPFATDFANVVAEAIRKQGAATVKVVVASPFKKEEAAIESLVASNADRLLLFTLTEWDADTYSQTTLHYDIKLDVMDAQGRKLAQSSVKGEDELKQQARPERRNGPAAVADLITTLMTDKTVAQALSGDVPAAMKGCSVDQILKMQQSGLTQEQIEAACGSGG